MRTLAFYYLFGEIGYHCKKILVKLLKHPNSLFGYVTIILPKFWILLLI